VKRVTKYLLTLLLLLAWTGMGLAADPPKTDNKMGIITGGEKGTYYQFGLDLQKLMRLSEVTLNVYNSKGSIENVFAVYQRPGIQLGIVQSDVLAFISRLQMDPEPVQDPKKTRMVFPLYGGDPRARPARARGFEDPNGKRVASAATAAHVPDRPRAPAAVDVKPSAMVPIDTDEALAELKAGRIDAMFYVAGYPVKLFKEGVPGVNQLALVPITSKSILELYPVAEIPPNTYSWQPGKVTTVAAKAVLISFDYRFKDCDSVGRFAQIMARRMDWLVQNGHPKWKQVDLNYQLKGWEQYSCVKKYLGLATTTTQAPPPADDNPVMRAIRAILDQQQ
jgi:TRAP transporter TAXI family solute receptor